MTKLLFILLLFASCSTEWHTKCIMKRDPHFFDSTTKYVPFRVDTIIYRSVYVPGGVSQQKVKFLIDSLTRTFNDSFVTVYNLLDTSGILQTRVIRKPYYIHDTIPITIIDSVKVNVPGKIVTVSKEVVPAIDRWIIIMLVALCLFLFLKGK